MSRPHSSSVDADTSAWGGSGMSFSAAASAIEYSNGNMDGDDDTGKHATHANDVDDDEHDISDALDDRSGTSDNVTRRTTASAEGEDNVAQREALISDIVNKQDGLKALLQRITAVQNEQQKLKSNNETLQTYIDNLTRANALGAVGAKR
ncbi:hypothetical protein ACM66B_006556 [Microbotryomycetes sp. NB124-2]